MRPLKRHGSRVKLYGDTSLVHPESCPEKLIQSIISCIYFLVNLHEPCIASDLLRKILEFIPTIKEIASTHNNSPELFSMLHSVCLKTQDSFNLVMSSLPDISSISTKCTICIPATLLVLEVINKLLFRIEVTLTKLSKKYHLDTENQVRIHLSQLNGLLEYSLIPAMKSDPEDIFYKPLSDPAWTNLKPYFTVVVQLFNDNVNDKFEDAYHDWENLLQILQASCKTSLRIGIGDLSNFLLTGVNAVYYSLFKAKAKQHGELFFMESNNTLFCKLWNMPKNPYVKFWYEKMLPDVRLHQVIYVPKLLKNLTVEDLKEKKMMELESVAPSFTLTKTKGYKEKYVKIRLISDSKLLKPLVEPNQEHTNTHGKITTLIVHIHGGGFVASSSGGHQSYLRKWAKCIPDSLIMSIDYRLAPAFVYPVPLDDVWQGYYWIVKHCKSQLGVIPSTLILVGDSAGGNFAMGVTLRAIHTGIRLPDGILLGYPALNLSVKNFTPSLLTSVDDYLLRFNVLVMCINYYIKDNSPSQDPYLSPTLISAEELAKFPVTRIVVAGRDPLRDESYKLLSRFVELNKDVYLKEYRSLPHGMWSFDITPGIEVYKYTVTDAAAWLKELIAKNETRIREQSKPFHITLSNFVINMDI